MKNNQGYYHWIHSLNQASKQVQHNHAKLLHEATYNPTTSGESGLKQGKARIHGQTRGGVVGSSGTEDQTRDVLVSMAKLLQNVNKDNPNPLRTSGEKRRKNVEKFARSITSEGGVGFDGEEYEDLGDEPAGPGKSMSPEQLADVAAMGQEKFKSTPHRTASAEDANANRERNIERARSVFAQPRVSPKFTSKLGAQARIEAGNAVAGDFELAAKDMKPTQADLDNNGIIGNAGDVALDASDNVMDRRANAGFKAQRNESVSNIINRMING
jgi:hypothetical protein